MGAARQEYVSSIGLLILRLGMGGYMLSHGWGKLQMLLAGDFDKFGDPIGVGSGASLVLIVLAEFFAALLVMLGLGTRYAAATVAIAMAVAAFVVHSGDPWSMETAAGLFLSGEAESWGSKEPAMLYLIPHLALVFTGAGSVSMDRWIWRSWRGKAKRD